MNIISFHTASRILALIAVSIALYNVYLEWFRNGMNSSLLFLVVVFVILSVLFERYSKKTKSITWDSRFRCKKSQKSLLLISLHLFHLELIRKVVTCCNFYNMQYAKPERILGYYRHIVTFRYALLTFQRGSYLLWALLCTVKYKRTSRINKKITMPITYKKAKSGGVVGM